MSADAEQTLERPDERAASNVHDRSGIGTIVVHILDDEEQAHLLETGVSLARECSAHLSCLHVTPIEAYVAFEKFGGVFVMNEVMRKIDEGSAALQMRVEKRLSKEGISWDYTHVTANVANALIGRSALADLILVARDPVRHDYVGPTVGFIGELLSHARTPLLIPSASQASIDLSGGALVAWDGSVEAANAVRAGLDLLEMAREVELFTVNEDRADPRKSFPATSVLEFLSRHGVHANLKVEPAPADDNGPDAVAAQIVGRARAIGASYILMGGYSHTRLSEYLFGGVTRDLLLDCPLALVLAR